MDVYVAGGIFLVAYLLIASERVDRTLVALLGGLLVVALGVIDQHEAFAAIDFNVIFLLAGMMILAGALKKTGFFEYVAGHAIRLSRGDPFRLLVLLATLTAGLSALLDNVTTVVLLTPVILSIARTLRVSPFPYLISGIFASCSARGRQADGRTGTQIKGLAETRQAMGEGRSQRQGASLAQSAEDQSGREENRVCPGARDSGTSEHRF